MIGHLVNALLGKPLQTDRNYGLSEAQLNVLNHTDSVIINGIVRCAVCGSYCGQCSTSMPGMTIDEFKEKY